MKSLIINGGKSLTGKVKISGAKNAALPILAASILTEERVNLTNVPNLSDISTMVELLENFGVVVNKPENNCFILDASNISSFEAPYEIVRKMRASFITLGGVLARFGEAKISLPGGCAIGTRPVDIHLDALEKMGAEISLDEGYVYAKTKSKRLQGADIDFAFPSVGATQNILIAASLASGTTIINNAAREPEISDLINFLESMGSEIEGAGTSRLIIKGKEKLNGTTHKIISDRIEAGTYLALAACVQGDITVNDVKPDILRPVIKSFSDMGLQIEESENSIRAVYKDRILPCNLKTEPYPGFPTDMQAQLVALMCLADGNSTMQENIFENRFMHIPELQRMGADIEVAGNILHIKGVEEFTAAEVMATDLRASVAMVMAALNAKGQTRINRIYHLERGYENIVEKLSSLGAEIRMEAGK
jgi:UDP-N-acetylglucosamine 1-carboxyvinyltransferase